VNYIRKSGFVIEKLEEEQGFYLYVVETVARMTTVGLTFAFTPPCTCVSASKHEGNVSM
jgi:hypothetical protein